MKTTSYVTAVVLVGVAMMIHFLAGLDWPWAIVAGAAVSILVRALSHQRATRSSRAQGS